MVALCALYTFVFLRTPWQFWFEDDANYFAIVRRVENPLRFLADRTLLVSVHYVTPMQFVSFWLDMRVAPESPAFAYLHGFVSLVVVSLLLEAALRRFHVERPWSVLAVTGWLLLPSTIAVEEFIAARHYLEGLGFSLWAVLLADDLRRGVSRRYLALALALAAAALSKELFAGTTTLVVLLLLIPRRASLIPLAVGAAYALYRLWALGGGLAFATGYERPFLSAREVGLCLLRLPWVFAGSALGYVLLGAALAALFLLLWKGQLSWRATGAIALVIVSALVTLYPVAYAVLTTWRDRGTWYRAPFLLDTILFVAGVRLIFVERRPERRTALVALAVAALLPGAWATMRVWDTMKARYALEARFYLDHPDRLVYSELPAFWYLEGLDSLYGLPPHSIHPARAAPGDRALAARFTSIWRYRDGKFVDDPALLQELRSTAPTTP